MNSNGKNGKLTTISIGTLNCRGIRSKTKRRAIFRQTKTHFDAVLLQDTHLDNNLASITSKEFRGTWNFNHNVANAGGVAVYNSDNVGRVLENDTEDYSDDKGRVIGRTIQLDGFKIYVISAYAPCVDSTTIRQQANYDFLKNLEQIIISKRSKGLEVLVGADLNFIRDSELDASGGEPKTFKRQQDWLNRMENQLGVVDALRFMRPEEKIVTWSRTGCARRLDYILCSKRLLERATESVIVPVPSLYPRLWW